MELDKVSVQQKLVKPIVIQSSSEYILNGIIMIHDYNT